MVQRKSYSEAPTNLAQQFSEASASSGRERYSAIQNNLMQVSFGSRLQQQKMTWLQGLQALTCKDGNTLATALIEAVAGVMKASVEALAEHP